MPNIFGRQRKSVNLSIRESVLEEAKSLGVDPSEAAEAGIASAIEDAREWQRIIEERNRQAHENGTLPERFSEGIKELWDQLIPDLKDESGQMTLGGGVIMMSLAYAAGFGLEYWSKSERPDFSNHFGDSAAEHQSEPMNAWKRAQASYAFPSGRFYSIPHTKSLQPDITNER